MTSPRNSQGRRDSFKNREEALRRKELVEKLGTISKNVIRRKRKGQPKEAVFDADMFGPVPPPDYYYRADVDAVLEEEEEEDNDHMHFTPIGRNAVELTNRFYIERNLYSYLANTTIPTDANYYDEDEVDISLLTMRPTGILILGKPGVGKTSLAARLARKLKLVHICPEEVIEYFLFDNKEAMEDTISPRMVAHLIQDRMRELDVLHRGYVLDGFPMIQSEDFPMEEQIAILDSLQIQPQYVIMLQMQDVDLYKRRIEQKYDPETGEIYIRNQYSKFNADADMSRQASDSHLSTNASTTILDSVEDDDPLDGSLDFPPLHPLLIFRLITRTEDNPVLVNDDLQRFRVCLPALQAYTEKFDKRKVLELDAYWAPSVVFRKTYDFLLCNGVVAASIPAEIMKNLTNPLFTRASTAGEFLGEDDDSEAPCPEDPEEPEWDWDSVYKAASVRGVVDPRFRWKLSRWKNLCPVALKYGRSVLGKPDLATSFLDKMFFLSTPDALEQFIFNPRPFLLPQMPTSPIKFFVLGHPLAGKTTFAQELAFLTDASVIDMHNEMDKRYGQIKNDYLYKKRLKYALEAKLMVDKENHKEWKTQERARRAAMHKWVDDYIRSLAEAEIRAALDADRERNRAERIQLCKETVGHKLKFPVHLGSDQCQSDDGWNKFCWNDFLKQIKEGKSVWTHQEWLQLAWDLFHDRRLYYKRWHKAKREFLEEEPGEFEEEFKLVTDLLAEDDSGEEEEGEVEHEVEHKSKKRRRRRRRCKKIHIKPIVVKTEVKDDEFELVYESSDIDPNDNETEESIRMRYPNIPAELVDIIPMPTMVAEHHPIVQDIVQRKLQEDEKYVSSLPTELYIEVLRRACQEAESKYVHENSHGPMSGGWIVENLITSLEKFRYILCTPEICPDFIFLLQDSDANHSEIHSRLTNIFEKMSLPQKKYKEYSPFPKDMPEDTLTAPFKDTPANIIQIFMDKRRRQSPVVEGDYYEELLTDQEQFVWEKYSSTDMRKRMKEVLRAINACHLTSDGGTGLPTKESLREDVRLIKEYLRHSREIGGLAYSLEDNSGAEEENVDEEEQEDETTLTTEDSSIQAALEEALSKIPEDSEGVDCTGKTLTEDEKTKCFSPKDRFAMQIRLFEEFWNQIQPEISKEGVKFMEVGMISEENVQERGLAMWNELEGRFGHVAQRISEKELKEEDEDIRESLLKWGNSNDPDDPVEVEVERERKLREKEQTDDEMGEDELQEDADDLSHFEKRPDTYWKTVRKFESRRCFGDMKYYCPVTFTEANLLRKGSPQFAVKFKGRLYYCGDEECVAKFLKNPIAYLPKNEPNCPPPPRICITGSPGCGQEEIALKIAKEHKICFVNFRQRLHELMNARLGMHVGPNKTGVITSRHESQRLIDNQAEFNKMWELDDEDEGEFDEDPEETAINESAMRTLGLLEKPEDAADPQAQKKLIPPSRSTDPPPDIPDPTSNDPAMSGRRRKKRTRIEAYVQAFLENGVQLPDPVLDEFVAPLWHNTPFDTVGFILVGFPNSEEDVKYLVRNGFYPEFVFCMECQAVVVRNRLLIETVDEYRRENNPKGKEQIKALQSEKQRKESRKSSRGATSEPLTSATSAGVSMTHKTEVLPKGSLEGCVVEFPSETWNYDDPISARISKALKHYHSIYSRRIRFLKQSLNRNNIDWCPVKTNSNFFDAKRQVLEALRSRLKYRSNIFEDIVRLDVKQANALLNKGVFAISKFQRWCPAEIKKGNIAINLWNAEHTQRIPILYRRYIYFVAGLKNAHNFQENCWKLVNQEATMNTVPSVIVILGSPKSGKTTLAQNIATRLGLVCISGSKMINDVTRHSIASQWTDSHHDIGALSDGPQPMMLADEVLHYLGNGQVLPKFLTFRALDLALQQAKAQYHGVVFDDYPISEEELQELLYRGVVPTTVIRLEVPTEEACERCHRNRKPTYEYSEIPEEGDSSIQFCTSRHTEASETTLLWFEQEVQNVVVINGSQNHEAVYLQVAQKCKDNMRKMQQYLVNVLLERPSTLEGTCPLTSQIPLRLSPDFGFYCPVALNDDEDLIRVADVTNLKEIVEYKGHVYVFYSEHNARKFMLHPKKYTVPDCARTPPKDVPITCLLTEHQFEELRGHWGFLDFDPVRYYYSDQHYEGLQRGDPKFCVAYRKRLYCFVDKENMAKFMRRPERFWNQMLPLKVPRKTEPLDMEKITPYCYLIANGVISEVKKVIQLAGEKRPRIPFMNPDRTAALFMGYYFKSNNMHAEFSIRQKYRNAMFDMMRTKNETKKFLHELEGHYGDRLDMLAERLKTKLDDFISLEDKPEEEKVHVPKLAGKARLSRETLDIPMDDVEIAHKYQDIKRMMVYNEVNEKLETFRQLPDKKKISVVQNMLLDHQDFGGALGAKKSHQGIHCHPHNLHSISHPRESQTGNQKSQVRPSLIPQPQAPPAAR